MKYFITNLASTQNVGLEKVGLVFALVRYACGSWNLKLIHTTSVTWQ